MYQILIILKKKILSEYSNELKDEIYEQFKDNKKIFNQEYVNWFEKDYVIDKYYNRKSAIYSVIDSFVYENRTKKFLKKYKNNIVKDNYYIFFSISHENDYNIYCENEEEYEYLKSIGVEFYKDHFVKGRKMFVE